MKIRACRWAFLTDEVVEFSNSKVSEGKNAIMKAKARVIVPQCVAN